MSEKEKIEYIKTHIEYTSYTKICDILKIHRKTMFKIMKDKW